MIKAGTSIDKRYEVISLLGRGGMGNVYKVHHRHLNTIHALKELTHNHYGASEQFQIEAQILAQLSHPQLPHVSDYFSHKKKYYLVMDYIEGQDLEQVLLEQIHLPLNDVVDWILQLLNIIEYIHLKKVVHRDIKPANIKLSNQHKIFLVDFGISKQISQHDTVFGAKGAFTPFLAAPEQIQGQSTDCRTDLYAVGITMAYLLTGQLPIPKSFLNVRCDISSELEAWLKKATAILPSSRFQSANEMRTQLKKISGFYQTSLPAIGIRRDLRKR